MSPWLLVIPVAVMAVRVTFAIVPAVVDAVVDGVIRTFDI